MYATSMPFCKKEILSLLILSIRLLFASLKINNIINKMLKYSYGVEILRNEKILCKIISLIIHNYKFI